MKDNLQRGESSSPGGQILAVTPLSVDSVLVVGHARDLGSCTVVKRDGVTCGSWYDKRLTGGRSICEYHFTTTVQVQRNQRAEFSARYVHPVLLRRLGKDVFSTSTLKSRPTAPRPSNRRKNKDEPDYDKKSGLLPGTSRMGGVDGEAVYMYSGSTVQTGGANQIVDEKIGRGREERLKRKRECIEAEKALAKLQKLQPDDHAAFSKVKVAQKTVQKTLQSTDASSENSASGSMLRVAKTTYSSGLVKTLGFNPSTRSENSRKSSDVIVKQKVGC